MPALDVSDFNIVTAVVGGFVLLFGLVSYFVKERLYLSEALIAGAVGVALGPHGADWLRPLDYAGGSQEQLDEITLAFTRLVLGVQLVLAGVQLPKKYLLEEWRSLAMLLGPVMTIKWGITSLLIWGLWPGGRYIHALMIAACITPTDPILANSIVKGKFADKHIPPTLQKIIVAESGANDGLGYPFVFLALYFIKYVEIGSPVYSGGASHALKLWFGETIGYVILLSVAYGAAVGWVAMKLLHWAERKKLVDRESFLVFGIALALFITGTCGMVGTDDVLACFIAGNVFSLDDWFRLETMDDSLQPTIDMLLNMVIFLYFGAVCPWSLMASSTLIPLSRLIPLGILIIVLRRPPVVLAFQKLVPQIRNLREAFFAGYFGPIGVSAVFYLYITTAFLKGVQTTEGVHSDDVHALEGAEEGAVLIVWIAVVASVVLHGITVPVIQLGNAVPLSRLPSMSRNTTATKSKGRASLSLGGFGTKIRTSKSVERGADINVDGDRGRQLSPERRRVEALSSPVRPALEPGLPTARSPVTPERRGSTGSVGSATSIKSCGSVRSYGSVVIVGDGEGSPVGSKRKKYSPGRSSASGSGGRRVSDGSGKGGPTTRGTKVSFVNPGEADE